MQRSYVPVTVVGVGTAGVRAVDGLTQVGLPAVRLVAFDQGRTPPQPRGLQPRWPPPAGVEAIAAGPRSGPALVAQLEPLLCSTDMCLLLADGRAANGRHADGKAAGETDAMVAAEVAVTVAATAREFGVLSLALAIDAAAAQFGPPAGRNRSGLEQLTTAADAAVIIPPARLSPGPVPDSPAGPVWRADALLCHGARSIAELVSGRSLIDLDLADLGSVFRDAGAICMGIGHGRGTRPVQPAVQDALAHPLTDCFQQGATRILLNVTVPPSVSLPELAADLEPALAESFPPGANILFGVVIDDELTDQAWVTVFAAGR